MVFVGSRRARTSAALCAALAGMALPASSTAAGRSKRSELPAALVALEKRMEALRFNSVRGRMLESMSGSDLGASGGALLHALEWERPRRARASRSPGDAVAQLPVGPSLSLTVFTGDFEASIKPRLLLLRGAFLGTLGFQVRVIGEDEYTRDPLFSLMAGASKPWVSSTAAERARSKEGSSAESVPSARELVSVRQLIAAFAKARSVIDTGPASIDGEHTTGFLATFGAERSSPRRRRRIRRTLRVYLTADGLPARTSITARLGTAHADATTDILATEVPVTVTPPPASETISQSELSKREESSGPSAAPHLTKRQKAEERRVGACVQRKLGRRKIVGIKELRKARRECERIAKEGRRRGSEVRVLAAGRRSARRSPPK